MGAAASKEQEIRDGWKASLTRTISAPPSRDRMGDEEDGKEDGAKATWRSKLLSQTVRLGKSFRNRGTVSKLKPLKEEEAEVDFDSLPEGFEAEEPWNRLGQERKNHALFERSMTFQPSLETETQERLVAPCRSFRASNSGGYKKTELSPRLGESMDRDAGLRLLLNSSSSVQSPSLCSPSRSAPLQKSPSTKERLYPRRATDLPIRTVPRICMDDASPLEPQWVSASSPLMTGKEPLFDPSLLATFEKAAEDVARGTQRTSHTSNLESTPLSSGAPLQTDKPKQDARSLYRMKSLRSGGAVVDKSNSNVASLVTFPFLKRKPSFSRVFSLKNDKRTWSSETYLDKFVAMCPPDCEGKVVLYFTTLRGVRNTYENCVRVRLILQGFRVPVDERDVWMHSKFRQELTDVMGLALSVPRLFILGRYIGGADEIGLLHEEGILAKLLEGLPKEYRETCEMCADVRFIPCIVCSGSCKIVKSSGAVERCPKCNENGLIMCPMCT